MKIRFDDAEYTLASSHVNVTPDHFQADVLKGEQTIDDLIDNVQGTEEIRVIDEDGSVMGVYRGYSEIIAIHTYDGIEVSVELQNKDIKSQINALTQALAKVEGIQSNQESMIVQVTEVANDLAVSQNVQDYAIEDLAEVVSDLVPEEE